MRRTRHGHELGSPVDAFTTFGGTATGGAQHASGAADEHPAETQAGARVAIKIPDREQANIIAELGAYQPIGDADIDRQWRDLLRDAFAQIAIQRKRSEVSDLRSGRLRSIKAGRARLISLKALEDLLASDQDFAA